MRRSAGSLGRDVGRLLRDGVDPPGGDARLLRRFAADRDPTAFEAIVDRHGAPVLAVCRRYLKDPADVEDAFQATFLVLVRKASGLRDGEALSSWLYGVAYRVAVRARSNALKRRDREGGREGLQDAPAEPSRPVDDALEVLDAELSRLPEKYRAPLALCYLDGRTHDQAAAELGWPVGTVRSRMAKGRSLLRDRLGRRGVDAPACLVALRAEVAAIPSIPSSLVAATASGAVRFAGVPAGLAWLGASPSSSPWPAARLALGVLATMSTTPWKMIGLVFVCAGITAGALASGSREAPGGPQDPPQAGAAPTAEPPAPESAATGVEGRLSEVERKLERMMGLLESLTARPESASRPPAPIRNDAPGALAFEARTLREIEAQLVSLERKYRNLERYLRPQNGVISEFEATNLMEDAVAPARLLVARLREMEDETRAEMVKAARTHEIPVQAIDDPAAFEAAAEGAYREAVEAYEAAVVRMNEAEEAARAARNDPNHGFDSEGPALRQARLEHAAAYATLKERAEFVGRAGPSALGDELMRNRRTSAVLESLAPTRAKLAEIRRLIAWAKSHFRDVELTVAEPSARGGAAAK